MRAPDSFPTNQAKPIGVARRNPPTARGRRSKRCTAAADSRQARGRWCRERSAPREDVDDASFPACVAREPGVSARVDVARTRHRPRHTVTPEAAASALCSGASGGPAPRPRADESPGMPTKILQSWSSSSSPVRMPSSNQVQLDPGEPSLEVGGPQVVRRVHALDAIAERIDIEVAPADGKHAMARTCASQGA